MEKIYVIAGPTASGKTAVAIALAKLIDGEIISADSMQIYKGMDIGTAKPSKAEQNGIMHYMIDIVTPDVPYSAALYQQQARAAIEEIQARRRIPILCGGTGFYINAVLRDINFAQDSYADSLGEYFINIAGVEGPAHLYKLLQETDPASAEAIHPNNTKRVIRALSYNHETGKLFSEYNAEQKKQPYIYDTVFCCLNIERPLLYQRINDRVLSMFDAGLEEEVSGLLAEGYNPNLVSMQGIGYKETIQYFLGNCTRSEAINTIQQNTRHYAKRQMTWFRNQNPCAIHIQASNKPPEEIAREIVDLYMPA